MGADSVAPVIIKRKKVSGGDGHHGPDAKSKVEGAGGILRPASQTVVGGGDGHRLATSTVADEAHAIQIHALEEGMA